MALGPKLGEPHTEAFGNGLCELRPRADGWIRSPDTLIADGPEGDENAAWRHHRGELMNFSIETEQEDDGRWLAEVPELPGVLAYGTTREQAQATAQVLALRVLADRLEHGEARPIDIRMSVSLA